MPALNAKQPSAIRETVKALCAWLTTNCPSIVQVYDQFPSPGEKLNYPSASVHSTAPLFTPLFPYVIAKGAKDPDTGLTPVTKVVGMMDFTLKLDLWCAYKPQRDSIFEEIASAFSLNSDVQGIDLTLTSYFNECIHYSISNVQYIEDEASAQRNEWRVIVDVLVNMRNIKLYSLKTIETIENNMSTPDTIAAPPSSSGDVLL
jgi:hypothetical protein